MFQSYTTSSDPGQGASRVALLRANLKETGLDGFLVPHGDAHQSEYLAPSEQRLAWLTGFGGSAGFAIVLADRAAIFVDGRYTLQVRDQVDLDIFEPVAIAEILPGAWLKDNAPEGSRIGYDPWLHTRAGIAGLEKACADRNVVLVPVAANPLDAVWTDRPEPPTGRVSLQPEELAGEIARDKIARIAKIVAEKKAASAVLTQTDSIAWLLNIRGSDVAHNPVALSYATLSAKGAVHLFIDERKLGNSVRAALAPFVEIAGYGEFTDHLAKLGRDGQAVLLDPASCGKAVADAIETSGGTVIEGTDPVTAPKAIKNAAEIAGTKKAHVRDGAAVSRFLAWLDREAPGGAVDEISAAKALEGFRAETGALKEISFDTISGAGPNGAIVHYRVTEETNRPLDRNSLYLCDSGGQYADGTTDITRTVAIGEPTAEMRDRFTRVLKGHIAIATARFPKGTPGAQIDGLARIALWKAGLDFDHGTGHGVGVYLGVHEGPQSISKRSTVAFEPGMIVSNEPGYYKTGEYGIRIENLELVRPAEAIPGGDREMLGFEPLTLVPFDQRLIDIALLDADERAWLDAYHARVRAEIGPLLEGEDKDWLNRATDPI